MQRSEYSFAVPSARDFRLLAVVDPITISVAGRFRETGHSPRVGYSGKKVVSVAEDICERKMDATYDMSAASV